MEDVIVFIANIIAVNDDDSHMILNILMNIADLLSLTEYKSFDEKYKGNKKYMAHTLVVYVFNILVVFKKLQRHQRLLGNSKSQIQSILNT